MNLSSKIWLAQHGLSLAVFVLTLVFASRLLRERRSPGGAIAWLLLIGLVPQIGLPLYLLFGWSKTKKRGPKKSKLYSPVHYSQTPQSAGVVERLLLASGAPERREGNQVELVADGVGAYERLLDLIARAKSTIHITTFVLGRDEVAAEILARLEQKAREGVTVRFLLDGYGALLTNRAALKKLIAAGGHFATFLPIIHVPFRGQTYLRNHRKLVLVDETHAIVGGMNLAREYMGPSQSPDRWDDIALHLSGQVIADLSAIFRSDWKFATGETVTLTKSINDGRVASAAAGVSAQVVASGPDVADNLIYDGLLEAVFEARHRIWISTPYFIPDETLTRALELASRRGVDVRVLVPRRSNHFLADIGRGSYIRQIEENGAKILLHPKMVHAKAMIIDDTYAIVGSANADMRSLFFNYEVCVFLYSQGAIGDMSRWFESLAKECDVGYPLPAFGRQTLEGISRILSPLL